MGQAVAHMDNFNSSKKNSFHQNTRKCAANGCSSLGFWRSPTRERSTLLIEPSVALLLANSAFLCPAEVTKRPGARTPQKKVVGMKWSRNAGWANHWVLCDTVHASMLVRGTVGWSFACPPHEHSPWSWGTLHEHQRPLDCRADDGSLAKPREW